jgi:hypothetical protein
MKRPAFPQLLLLILIGGFAGMAAAQTPAPATIADDGATAAVTAIGTSATDNVNSRNCLQDTGSRITASANAKARKAGKKERECANSPGRSYSKEDIDRTGQTDIASALRQLDPSIR